MTRQPSARWRIPVEVAAAVLVVICAVVVIRSRATPVPAPAGAAPVAGAPSPTAPPNPAPPNPATPDPPPTRYVFPVAGPVSYSAAHHDYPATDIMAACGLEFVAVSAGLILETTVYDAYDPGIDAGETRGGLSVSLLGDDGVRYYGSHLSEVDGQVRPGARVTPGQRLGVVGETGDASACHLHFGISPPCARVGDWWTRRGVIPPASYLDSWRAGGASSPAREVNAWHDTTGCPTAPTVLP